MNLPPGARLGRYKILEKLGEGGMGAVYKAEDAELGRMVAVKLASAMLVSDATLAKRFVLEGRAAASVESPHVARVHEVGEERGLPFLVMELLPGGTLKGRLKTAGRLSWREAASLGAQVARGLEAIHARGLVHRDLKPENVLLDEEGRCKLADFGLVRAEGASIAESIGALTRTGEIMGTLNYMAPEQADGKKVGPPADVYSLGATLYVLLAGKPPLEGTGVSLLKKILSDRPPSLSKIVPETPSDLVALVDRCLSKRPGERPAASEVASALEALARQAPRRASSRRPGAALLLLAAAAAAAVAVFLGLRSPRGPEPTAPPHVQPPSTPPPPPPAPPPTPAPVTTLVCFDEKTAALCSGFRAVGNVRLTHVWGRFERRFTGGMPTVQFTPDSSRIFTTVYDTMRPRGSLWDVKTGSQLDVAPGCRSGFLSPEGDRILGIGDGDRAFVWSIEKKAVLLELGEHVAAVAAWSPGGDLVATGAGNAVRVFDSATGKEVRSPIPHAAGVRALAFLSADEGVSGQGDGTISVWKTRASTPPDTLSRGESAVNRFAVQKDSTIGTVLAAASDDGAIRLYDVPKRRPIPKLDGHPEAVHGIAFDPENEDIIASVGYDGSLRFWDTSNGAQIGSLPLGDRGVGLAFSPDGKWLAAVTESATWRLFRREGGGWVQDPTPGPGHEDRVTSVHSTRSGDCIVSSSFDGSVKTWSLEQVAAVRSFAGGLDAPHCRSARFTPDEKLVFGAFELPRRGAHTEPGVGWLHYFDRETGADQFVIRELPLSAYSVAVSSDRRFLFVGSLCRTLRYRFMPAGSYSPVTTADEVPTEDSPICVASADGSEAVLAGAGLRVCAFEGTAPVRVLEPRTMQVFSVCLLKSGRALSGGGDGRVKLWDVRARELLGVVGEHQGWVSGVSASPDGKYAVSAGTDQAIRLWDVERRALLETISLASSDDEPTCVDFGYDGKSFLVGTARGVVLRFVWTP